MKSRFIYIICNPSFKGEFSDLYEIFGNKKRAIKALCFYRSKGGCNVECVRRVLL